MGIGSFTSAPWRVAIGSVEEVVSFMGTGSITPISIKSVLQDIPATGSVSVIYIV